MTEFQKADKDSNGSVDEHEFNEYKAKLDLENQRRVMEDEDAQRDQQRKMVWWVLAGMLGYPLFVIGSSVLGLNKASDILGSMASIYFPSTSLILAAFFGANAYTAKKEGK